MGPLRKANTTSAFASAARSASSVIFMDSLRYAPTIPRLSQENITFSRMRATIFSNVSSSSTRSQDR
jgi:hypothetical protein